MWKFHCRSNLDTDVDLYSLVLAVTDTLIVVTVLERAVGGKVDVCGSSGSFIFEIQTREFVSHIAISKPCIIYVFICRILDL